MASLPLSDLIIVRCTKEQTLECRKHAWGQWGYSGHFTLDGWVGRDAEFDKTEWAKRDGGNGFVTWGLVPKSDPKTLDLLAHCETYRRPSIAKRKGLQQVEDVVSYGIATVITPPAHRGRHYARQLLQLLHYIIAPVDQLPPFPESWGSAPQFPGFNDAAFSNLYSGVGTKYYAAAARGDGDKKMNGWVWEPTITTSYKLEDVTLGDDMTKKQEGWKWLSVKDVADLEPQIAQYMRESLQANEDKNCYAVLPTDSTLSLHAFRNTLSPSGQPPASRTYGLMLPLPGNPFVIYTYPTAARKMALEVTYLHPDFPFSALLAAAKREKCVRIDLWGPSSRGGKSVTEAALRTRQKWDSEAEFLGIPVGKDREANTACWVVYESDGDNDWCFREKCVLSCGELTSVTPGASDCETKCSSRDQMELDPILLRLAAAGIVAGIVA